MKNVNDQKPEFQLPVESDAEYLRIPENSHKLKSNLFESGSWVCTLHFPVFASLLEFKKPPLSFFFLIPSWSVFTSFFSVGSLFSYIRTYIIGIIKKKRTKQEDVVMKWNLFFFFNSIFFTFFWFDSFLQRADEGMRVLAASLINYPFPMEMSATSFDGYPFFYRKESMLVTNLW